MACKNCSKIRSAILQGKMAEAAGITIEVLRAKIGLSPAGEPLIDASTLPSLAGRTKAELLAIADNEDVEVSEGATNAEIVEAIEAKRELVTA